MTPTDLRDRLATVVGIPVVPYAPDGSVDLACATALATRLFDAGVTALTPNGNTGEFYALTPTERRQVLDAVVAARRPGSTVVAGVGFDVDTAARDARYARSVGADAVMVHQPVGPYLSADGWVDYNVAVAEAVPEIGVVPYLSTTAVTGRDVERLAEHAPNVVALKYSVPDPVYFAEVRDAAGHDLLWIAGLAEAWAPSYWQAGARGFTSGLVNVAPRLSLELLRALRDGRAATVASLERRIRPFESLRARNRSSDNVSVVKEAMHRAGLCDRSVRPPSAVLGPEAVAQVEQAVASWDPSTPTAQVA